MKKDQVSNPSLFNLGREIVLGTTKRKAMRECNLGNSVFYMVCISLNPIQNSQMKI